MIVCLIMWLRLRQGTLHRQHIQEPLLLLGEVHYRLLCLPQGLLSVAVRDVDTDDEKVAGFCSYLCKNDARAIASPVFDAFCNTI